MINSSQKSSKRLEIMIFVDGMPCLFLMLFSTNATHLSTKTSALLTAKHAKVELSGYLPYTNASHPVLFDNIKPVIEMIKIYFHSASDQTPFIAPLTTILSDGILSIQHMY